MWYIYNVINIYVSCVPSSEYMFFCLLVVLRSVCVSLKTRWSSVGGSGGGGGEKRAAPVWHQPIHTTIQRLLGTNHEMCLYDSHPRQGTRHSVQLPSHIKGQSTVLRRIEL